MSLCNKPLYWHTVKSLNHKKPSDLFWKEKTASNKGSQILSLLHVEPKCFKDAHNKRLRYQI